MHLDPGAVRSGWQHAVNAEHGRDLEACIADFQATERQSAGAFHGLAR